MPIPYADLFRHDGFRRYFASYVLFILGNSLSMVIVPLIILDETGSAALTALAATFGYFPFLVFGLVAGAVSDHLDKRLLMTLAGLVAGLAMAVLVGFPAGSPQLVPVLFAVKFVSGSAEVWHTMTHFGTLPFLVPRARLAEASAVLQGSLVVIGLFAPLTMVWVLHETGHRPVFAVIAAVFLLSSLVRWRARDDNGGIPATTVREAVVRIAPNVVQGFRFAFGNRFIRVLTVTGFCGSVGYGVVNALIAVYLFSEFGIPASDPMQGVFLTVASAGVFTSMWLLPTIRRALPRLLTIALVQSVVMLSSFALAVSPAIPVALVAFAVFQGWGTLMFTNLISLRMEVLPLALQGRVGSVSRLIGSGGVPVGGVVGGLALSWIGIRELFLLSIAVWLLSIAVCWRNRAVTDAGLLEEEDEHELVTG